MKTKIFIYVSAMLISGAMLISSKTTFAQSPYKMSYQAVVRNSSNGLVSGKTVGVRISILQGTASGSVVYTETQTTNTNANGLVSLEIGNGTGFSKIDWGKGPFFIKTEFDPTGGTYYTITGTNQLLSVPFALHAQTADNAIVAETDPVYAASPAGTITSTNITNWNSAFGWGNHATAGYLKSFTELDPVFGASPAKIITTTNIANWTVAYSWGNHAGLYRPITYVPDWSEITANPFKITSPAAGQTLKFNVVSGKFENGAPDYYTKTEMQTPGVAPLNFGNLTNKPTTLSGYGITDAALTTHTHTLDGLSNVKITTKADANVLQWDNATSKWVNRTLPEAGIQPAGNYLTANQTIKLSGDVLGTGTTSIATTLAKSGVIPDTYTQVTVNNKGIVTAGGNPTTLDEYHITDALSIYGGTMIGKLITALPTASRSGLNLPHGVIPTAPVNGDLWTTTTGLYVQVNGLTLGLTGATGTVLSVGVVPADGITASVATPNTTPVISMGLGAITPVSVTTTGDVTGNTLISTVPTGTSPLVVASTTPVANLSIDGNAKTATTTTHIAGGTGGEIPYQTGVATTALSTVGTAGQVLTSGGALAPTWTTSTDANTAGAIVQRDASGNFAANNIAANDIAAAGNTDVTGNTTLGGTLAVTGITTLTAAPVLSSTTASQALFTDATKKVVSNPITGTGNVAMSDSPTLTGIPVAPTAAPLTSTTQLATTAFVTSAVTTATPDATPLVKGILKLNGDLNGVGTTADAPVISLGAIDDSKVAAGANIADTKLATIATPLKVSNSATTATSTNTASAIVARDASGNFAANNITANDIAAAGNTTVAGNSTVTGNTTVGGTLAVTGVATLTAAPVLTSTTASQALFTDASKNVVSNPITGTGNVVMSASPTLTGIPVAPTAAPLTSTTQIATTDFVTTAITTATPDATTLVKGKVKLGGDLNGVGTTADAPTITLGAIDDSKVSATANIADTKLATISTAGKVLNSATTATSANTANAIVTRDASGNFAANNINAANVAASGNTTVGGTLAVTGVTTLTAAPVLSSTTPSQALFTDATRNVVSNPITGTGNVVMSASPTLTGIPVAPTAIAGTSTTQIATTDFVTTAVTTATPDATTLVKGKVKLGGDLNGVGTTADAPVISLGAIDDSKVAAGANIADTKLATIATPLKVSNSATTATSTNTASAIVARDASGNFAANNITANDIAAAGNTTVGGTMAVTGVTTLTAAPVLSSTTASQALFTDATKKVVSNPITGTGNVVMSDSPSLTGIPIAPTAIAGTNTTQVATTAFVTSSVATATPDATTSATGKIQLAGDLGGTGTTATAPVITDLAITNNKVAAGAIDNSKVAAGANIADTKLATISTAGKVSNSATTATSANTASAIVARDASGNFAANNIAANDIAAAGNTTVAGNSTVTGNTTVGGTMAVTGVTTLTAAPVLSSTTASQALFTDATKKVVSNPITGTGNVVMSDSPSLTGTPIAPTAIAGTSTTQIATTAFVTGSVATATPDATTSATGKVQLAGDLGGTGTTATAPVITDLAITNNKVAAGAIDNSKVAAGANIADTKLATISTAGKVSNSATTATSANTANAIVARDASGNFAANNIAANDIAAAGNTTVAGNSTVTGNTTVGGTLAVTGVTTLTAAPVLSSTTVDPNEIVAEYGTDALRYYVAREISPFEDSPFTKEMFKDAYNANLANGLGNLVSRVMTMSQNNIDKPIKLEKVSLSKDFKNEIEKFNLQKATDTIFAKVKEIDAKIQTTQPFKLVKTDKKKATEIIKELVQGVYEIAVHLEAILPETSEKIKKLVKENKKPETPLFVRKD